jgi:Ca2+-transporting ATPase
MIRRILHSSFVIGGGGFAVFWWLLRIGYSEFEARNLLLLLFVLFENFQTFNSRSERHSVFKQSVWSNPLLVVGVIAAQGLHVAAMHVPLLAETLSLAPVSLREWGLLLGCASLVLLVMETEKWLDRRRR